MTELGGPNLPHGRSKASGCRLLSPTLVCDSGRAAKPPHVSPWALLK